MSLENNGERGVNEEKGSDIQVGHILLYNSRPNIVCLGVAEIRQFRSGCDQSGPTSTFIPIVERQQSAGVLRFPFLHLLFWIHVLLRELL